SQHVEFIRRQGNYTQKEHLEQYKPSLSFVDRLPWVEFLDENKTLLLEDGRSVGAVFEITVIGTEGRSAEFLANARTQVCHAIQDSFPELDMSPWVVQFYC
ncbi:TraC family protein, partial [Glaesserella parasuis]